MYRTLAVHFTDPFHVSTRVADKCSDGTLLLQVMYPQLPSIDRFHTCHEDKSSVLFFF